MKKKLAAAIIIMFTMSAVGCTASKDASNRYTGTVEAESFFITSQVSGQVTDVFVKEGDKITAGLKTAQVDSRVYQLNKEAAEGSLKSAKARFNMLPDNSSNNKKNELEGLVESASSQVKLCQLQIDNCSIKSLNSGVVTDVYVNKGETASAALSIAKAYDPNSEYIKVYIEENKRSRVQLGKELNVYLNDNQVIKGKISYISPESEFTPKNIETKEDKQNTVFMIKIQLSDKDKTSPGLMADVELN